MAYLLVFCRCQQLFGILGSRHTLHRVQVGEDRSAGGARFEWVQLPDRQGGPNHLHALCDVGHDEVGVGEQREMDRLAGRITQRSEELACLSLQG